MSPLLRVITRVRDDAPRVTIAGVTLSASFNEYHGATKDAVITAECDGVKLVVEGYASSTEGDVVALDRAASRLIDLVSVEVAS